MEKLCRYVSMGSLWLVHWLVLLVYVVRHSNSRDCGERVLGLSVVQFSRDRGVDSASPELVNEML